MNNNYFLKHEMIHAYLFVTNNNKDHDDHGTEFHKHMFRINKQSGANITVYFLLFCEKARKCVYKINMTIKIT